MCLLLSFLDNSATKPLCRARLGMVLSDGRRWLTYGGGVVEMSKYMEEAFNATNMETGKLEGTTRLDLRVLIRTHDFQ